MEKLSIAIILAIALTPYFSFAQTEEKDHNTALLIIDIQEFKKDIDKYLE